MKLFLNGIFLVCILPKLSFGKVLISYPEGSVTKRRTHQNSEKENEYPCRTNYNQEREDMLSRLSF